MIQVLISLVAFVVAIGVMVTVHEYGHYWVARRCGVRVLRFSVGFGRPLWRRVYGTDQTEWVIAAIPLGGYVKMLDEREVDVAPGERHRAFNRKPLPQRAAIVAAGPAVNVLLAVVAYALTFLIGVQGVVPRLGDVATGTPAAAAGLERGDRIVALAGERIETWTDARLVLIDAGLSGRGSIEIVVRREGGDERTRQVDVSGISLAEPAADPVRGLGLEPWLPELPPRIEAVQEDSPAARAGFEAGDRVVSAGDTRIDDWRDWVAYVQARPGETIPVVVERDGATVELEVTPASVDAGARTIGRIGARGPRPSAADRDRMLTTVRHGPVEALVEGVAKTWDVATLTVRVLYGMVTGQASLSNISGPVSIAHYAGQSMQLGLTKFIGFIALISVSIGILNLLPIPILDGGHLLFYAIEAIKGSPVSERAQAVGQQIGLGLLFALMALALYNDFVRLAQ